MKLTASCLRSMVRFFGRRSLTLLLILTSLGNIKNISSPAVRRQPMIARETHRHLSNKRTVSHSSDIYMHCKCIIFGLYLVCTISDGKSIFNKLQVDSNQHISDCAYSYTYRNGMIQQKWLSAKNAKRKHSQMLYVYSKLKSLCTGNHVLTVAIKHALYFDSDCESQEYVQTPVQYRQNKSKY